MNEDDDHAEDLQRIADQYDLIQWRRGAGPLEREAWIAASRQIFSPGDRQPCYVCGKFRGIAQAHHVVPLTTQYDRGFRYPDHEHEWLCPNHHVMAHLFILDDGRSMRPQAARARSRTTSILYEDIDEHEFNRLMDLMRRAGRVPE